MSSETVIRVDSLSKHYQLFSNPRDRLKQLIFPALRSKFGLNAKDYFKPFIALDNVSFEVKQGETFGVIGKNGSGKSTLLQLLCGTLSPTEGQIHVKGKVAALLELGAGFNPEFTGRENVYLNGQLYGLTKAQIDERFEKIAAFAEIGDFIEQQVKTYSSGMYVRLAFAVIAHVDAEILIVDEALSVGDAYFVQKCMRFLRDFMGKGTLLFVSHDIGAVANLCSRAMWLNRGKLIDIGSPKSVINHYLEGIAMNVVNVNSQTPPLKDADTYVQLAEVADVRDALVSNSNLKNVIKLYPFKVGNGEFGAGGAKITDAALIDIADGKRLIYVVGGELVCLQIKAEALTRLEQIVMGFDFKDRLGQTVFSDNTFLSYRLEPKNANAGERLLASFDFFMPTLPVGDYAISVAIATGSQDSHVQQNWKHDAIIVKSQSSRVLFGLVGIPMRRIELDIHKP
jgi:lipopolysaccharide transport system ATP-binding protein